jgi:hypothetical protein
LLKLKDIDNFVENAVTKNRLAQGLDYMREMNYEISIKNIYIYLKWLRDDTFKEEGENIILLGLDKKEVVKKITTVGQIYFNFILTSF